MNIQDFVILHVYYKGEIKTILIFSVPKSQNSKFLSGKLSCNWLIMLVILATLISSHVKDKNGMFTAHDEDMTF